MYDRVNGEADLAQVAKKWFTGFFLEKLVVLEKEGIETMPLYYDPEVDLSHGYVPLMGLGIAWYLLPFSPSLAKALYDAVVKQSGMRESAHEAEASAQIYVFSMIGTGCVGTLLCLSHLGGTQLCVGWIAACIGVLALLSQFYPWLSVHAVIRLTSYNGLTFGMVKHLATPRSSWQPWIFLLGLGIIGLIGWLCPVSLTLGIVAMSLSFAASTFTLVVVAANFGSLQLNQVMLALAIELGDSQVEARMRDLLEPISEPRSFNDGCFGYFYHLPEKWPRGQLSALRAAADVDKQGAWAHAFNNRCFRDRFSAPTVEGVDFPTLGVSQAWNDAASGTLTINIYAATPSSKNQPTNFRVSQLPHSEVNITCDGQPFLDWQVLGKQDPFSLQIDTSVNDHTFVISTGYTGGTGV